MDNSIWVFCGNRAAFPSGLFSSFEAAKRWIAENRLSGTLSKYPLDIPLYDWAISNGFFEIKKPEHRDPGFIAKFTCANVEHYHYENGVND
jgi:hypothetical protein